ncbi:MAG: metal-dependent hydrolase [Euryarchaeota archaeon]|nr:metal-dependent hydrolase [Euryarchaeota archaeon]
MRPAPHLLFGLFTGLLVYYLSREALLAGIVFAIQVGLIADALSKRLLGFEPLHTLLGMAAVSFLLAFYSPKVGGAALLAYSSHLALDLLVEEKIELLLPFSRRTVQHPVEGSEAAVMAASGAGIIAILLLLILEKPY